MSPRTSAGTRATASSPGGAANPKRPIDDRWNEQMTSVLRRAAEVRESRERARSSEDQKSARRETEALLAMIQGKAAPRGSGSASNPAPRTPPSSSR